MTFPATPSYQLETAECAYAITPSDTVNETYPWKYLYVGGAGAVSMVDSGGNTVVFPGVPAGTQLFIAGKRVNVTGTTATNLVGMM